jgi:hypothetical protein
MSRDSDAPPPDDSERLGAKVKALESEIVDLKIANRAKDPFIEQLRSERSIFLDPIAKQGRETGRLETRLEIQAGSPASPLPDPEPPEAPPVPDPSSQAQGPRDSERTEPSKL